MVGQKIRTVLLTLVIFGPMLPSVSASSYQTQASDKVPANEPTSVTTSDPDVPEDYLRLLVKPLTQEELVIEAGAWRDLLKNKIQQIVKKQIAVKEHAAAAEQAAIEARGQDEQGTLSASTDIEEAKDNAKEEDENKRELADELPELQAKKALLVARLNVVIDSLEKKGREQTAEKVTSYRQYIAAVNGIDLDVTDASTTWTQVKGWISSEQGGQRWAWNLLKFFLILAAFFFASRLVSFLVRRASTRIEGASQLLTNFLGKFVRQLVILIGLVVALAALEVNIGPLLAAIGAAGFIVAFALQDTLSNFASGLLILAYRPFDVGDFVEAGGVSGSVKSVSLFSTHIATTDNKMMIVPNNDIWGGTITNATASDTRRVDLVFGIGYQDDINQAKGILARLLKDHELVLDDPAPVVQLNELADSSVNFVCRPWTKTENYWTVYWDITQAVKEAFDEARISIPYPQRDLHVFQESASTDDGVVVVPTH